MMKSNKPTVVWLQGVTCNGNTHSFLCSNGNRFELFMNSFELLYHPSLTYDIKLEDILKTKSIDFLLVEGAITNDEYFYSVSNKNIKNVFNLLLQKSKYIIAVGSCASYGGLHKKFEDNESLCGLSDAILEKYKEKLQHPIVNLTGCPVHPEWILQTLFTLKSKKNISLDSKGRPVDLYSGLAHHGCTRNEYFEWKVEAHKFGEKEGCLFYEQGCRGPMTQSNCNKILWNDVSTKTRSGMPCIGCTEFDFPRNNMLETKKNIGIPLDIPIGIPKRAYLSITGIAKTFKIDRLHKKLGEE